MRGKNMRSLVNGNYTIVGHYRTFFNTNGTGHDLSDSSASSRSRF
jgi:hypothetical protein